MEIFTWEEKKATRNKQDSGQRHDIRYFRAVSKWWSLSDCIVSPVYFLVSECYLHCCFEILLFLILCFGGFFCFWTLSSIRDNVPVTTPGTGGLALWASVTNGMWRDMMWLPESSFLSQDTHCQPHLVLCYIFQIKDASFLPGWRWHGQPTWDTWNYPDSPDWYNYEIICE